MNGTNSSLSPTKPHLGSRERSDTPALMIFFWDRNYEFKARLWEEELYLPQVAVGIRDMVGTGVFGSEYIVGSKRFGNTDITWGLVGVVLLVKVTWQSTSSTSMTGFQLVMQTRAGRRI